MFLYTDLVSYIFSNFAFLIIICKIYVIMSSEKFNFFLSNLYDFFLFVLMYWFGHIMLDKSDEKRHPCLVPNLKRKTSIISSLNKILPDWGSSYILLLHWEVIPTNQCWILTNAFSASPVMIMFSIFPLILLTFQR